MNKRIIVFITFTTTLVLLASIFLIQNNKIKNIGNNISTTEDLQKYILNITSYDAIVSVTVKSNKTTNKYKLKQKYSNEGNFFQEVIEPENIAGTTISMEGNTVKIENTRLNVQKIYEDYEYIGSNQLELVCFIKDFLNSADSYVKQEEDTLIFETVSKNENIYISKKILYVDIKTKKPTKMEIKDHTQNTLVYILYSEINFSSNV